MLTGLIGKKLGMTELTDAAGRVRAVTVIQLGPCTVTQLKTEPTDGYDAVQVTFGKKKLSRVTSPERGHFAKAKIAAGIKSAEFPRRGQAELALGQAISAGEVFKEGDQVDIRGISKGRGYAGVIKRHHFSGFPGSHGTHEYFRHGGSIGNRSYPGRVRKGMRMAGQMGNATASILNLEIVEIMPDDNAIVVTGSVPGADNSIVIVEHAARHAAQVRPGSGQWVSARHRLWRRRIRSSCRYSRPRTSAPASWKSRARSSAATARAPAARGGADAACQPALGNRVDQDPRSDLRRRPQALAAEGHRTRARRLDALADMASRRNDLRSAAARLFLQDARSAPGARRYAWRFRIARAPAS